jgi:hypothetical protein
MPALPLLLLASVSTFASPAAQESCPNCLHRGVIACREHVDIPREEEEPTPENPMVYCSWAAACTACGGTMWVDCPRCSGGDRSAEIEEKRNVIRSWLENNQLQRKLGRPVGQLETKRFAIAVDVAELQTEEKGKKKMTAHALAHLLARDGERVAAMVAEQYAMTDMDYRARMRMWLWSTAEAHREAQKNFQGTVTGGDFKLLGRDPVFSVWTEPGDFDTVPKVRALFVHNGAHMLLSNAFQPMWVGDIGGGWLDVGIGAWYEYELFGRVVNYCVEESTIIRGYEDGQWRGAVRRRLEKEKDRFLPLLLTKRTGEMTAAENALCWSFYDYLLAEHPGVVRKLMIDLKQKKPAREVLQQQLGMDLFALEDAWRAWASEAYPLQGDEPKTPKKGKKK